LAERQQTPAWTMADVLRYFADNQAAKAPPDYISYGIREIDEGSYTEPGDVVILGGYPSDGKTAFALALAYHMAQKHRVGFFSLETGPKKLADRLASHALQISFDDIKRRTMTESDWTRLANANADFTGRNLTFLSASGQSVAEITATSQAMGFDIILIDYVQLIKPALWRRYSTDASAMAGISMDLHTWAQRTGTLVIELAQLTRPQKQGKWREPDMHDLKESGQFEQDADTIFLLFSPKPGGDYDPDKSRIIKIAKNKEGRRGRWPLYFDGEHQTFSVMAGADGRAIARKYSDAARRNKALGQIHGQQQFVETTDDRNMPF
jgi:replicative DNA helicase